MEDASTAHSFGRQFRSFNHAYWVSNVIEMFERLAYYGLRTVLPIYMVLAVSEDGPQFTHIQKGEIFAWWALVQSGLPIVTGGFADRFGYKLTVAISIAIKMVGYLVMAYATDLAALLTDGASAAVPGHEAVFSLFLVGALALAGGTAIFKPGIQGILAYQLNPNNSSLGWSVFYQVVNVGGFLGPILAGVMRLMAWRYVFIACAVIVAGNYLFLFMFKEPKVETEKISHTPFRKAVSLGTLSLIGGLLALAGAGDIILAASDFTVSTVIALTALVGALAVLLPVGWAGLVKSSVALHRAAPAGMARVALPVVNAVAIILPLALLASGGLRLELLGDVYLLAGDFGDMLRMGAALLAYNFTSSFLFSEPTDSPGAPLNGPLSVAVVLWDSLLGILEPRLLAFLVVFSGFWAMFYQLFDLLPNYIADWVDSRGIADLLVAPFVELPTEWAGHLPQEYMINLNAGMCMTVAFLVGYLTGKVRSMVAMIGGMAVASTAIWSLGFSENGWLILLAIALFSMGELMSSPTKMRYFSGLAPAGKKALYLGYINATSGIGWFLGSKIAGKMYEEGGDKVNLARRHLIEVLGQNGDQVAAMDKALVLPNLGELLDLDSEALRELLFAHYDPSFVWSHFALIGVVSMVGLICFDVITRGRLGWHLEAGLLMVLTGTVAAYTYGWEVGAVFASAMIVYVLYATFAKDMVPQE